jgi:carboxypeptidase-like protein
MKYPTLFFIACLIGRGLTAQIQVYSLSGSVTDSTTGKPIPAVSVFLSGTSKGTITKDDGSFLLIGIPPGGYQLVISAISYATFQTNINTRELPTNLNVALHPRAADLAAVTVEPLIIVNIALGYTIEYRLENFSYDLSRDAFAFYGHPLYREMTPRDSV